MYFWLVRKEQRGIERLEFGKISERIRLSSDSSQACEIFPYVGDSVEVVTVFLITAVNTSVLLGVDRGVSSCGYRNSSKRRILNCFLSLSFIDLKFEQNRIHFVKPDFPYFLELMEEVNFGQDFQDLWEYFTICCSDEDERGRRGGNSAKNRHQAFLSEMLR